ncbi:hypothetical protein Desaci_0073 [Desulfosporosinus acidiphilus SJ4]|uniref:Uncharacterized protein n=1 Tax=Desulfosporosinus acidiphilus (strain DSM 22704 / JCM 16185 / SJ4) TaxID=646529 RepID=I4D064_DESAJ|nr:hypothetical protein Desaci_0073 [Desulfosporosinus acidiphilus SJ4]
MRNINITLITKAAGNQKCVSNQTIVSFLTTLCLGIL